MRLVFKPFSYRAGCRVSCGPLFLSFHTFTAPRLAAGVTNVD